MGGEHRGRSEKHLLNLGLFLKEERNRDGRLLDKQTNKTKNVRAETSAKTLK